MTIPVSDVLDHCAADGELLESIDDISASELAELSRSIGYDAILDRQLEWTYGAMLEARRTGAGEHNGAESDDADHVLWCCVGVEREVLWV